MIEFVTVQHPDITVPARVARSALPHLDPRWRVVGEDDIHVEPEQPPEPDPVEDSTDPGPDGAPVTAPSKAHNRPRRTA